IGQLNIVQNSMIILYALVTVLSLLLLATYTYLLREFLKKHWRTVLSYATIMVTLIVAVLLAVILDLPSICLRHLQTHFVVGIKRVEWTHIVITILVLINIYDRMWKKRPEETKPASVQQVSNSSSDDELTSLRRDVKIILECLRLNQSTPTYHVASASATPEQKLADKAVAKLKKRKKKHYNQSKPTQSQPVSTPQPVKSPEPVAETPPKRPARFNGRKLPKNDNDDNPIDHSGCCQECGRFYRNLSDHLCWQTIVKSHCYRCGETLDTVLQNRVGARG